MKCFYDVAAPAKLNLFLHIVGRRADGYHLLESAFMLIDWCDTLHFELRTDGQLSREDINTPLPELDLILKAAHLLKSHTNCPLGAHIGVEKSIPPQAGMGGGSSDAASTLLALNRLWGLGLSVQQLMPLGLKLGADVPFFLGGHNAWVSGIGETLEPIDLTPAQFVVLKPPCGLSTQEIFSASDLQRNTPRAILSGFAADTFHFGCNDLQPVALKLSSGVSDALFWLQTQGLCGRMTGSGSAVFALCKQKLDLTTAPKQFQIKVCNNLQAHPLLGWASSEVFGVSSLSETPA